MDLMIILQNGFNRILTKENKLYPVEISYLERGSCNIYADDTLIYCTGNNITGLKYNIQKCVTDVHEWYESNKLVINTSKSNVMLLTTIQMLSNMRYTALNVFIGNQQLPQCNSIKYIDVVIGNVLSCNLQTDSISKKLVFIISRLSRLKPVLPSQMLYVYIYEHYPTEN